MPPSAKLASFDAKLDRLLVRADASLEANREARDAAKDAGHQATEAKRAASAVGWNILFAFLGAAALIVGATASIVGAITAPPAITVIDGDTIKVGDEHIRLMGFDAPELHGPRCPAEARLAAQAKQVMEILVKQPMRLERLGNDKYGRTLARGFIGRDDIGALMIGAGLARPYDGGRREPWCP